MRIMALSGLNGKSYADKVPYRLKKLNQRLETLNPRSFAAHLIRNEIDRLNKVADRMPQGSLRSYASLLQDKAKQYVGKPGISWLIQKELRLINDNKFTGKVAFNTIDGIGKPRKKRLRKLIKKVGKGLKKVVRAGKMVALAPARNSFLALIRLNLRGLANKLQRVKGDKIFKLWDRLGGKRTKLASAISKGAKKRPLLGSRIKGGVRRRRVSGFNEVDNMILNRFNKPVGFIGVQPMPDDSGDSGAGAGVLAAGGTLAAGLVASNPATGGTAAAIIGAAAPILIAFTKLLKKEGLDTPEGMTDIDTGEIVGAGTGSLLENLGAVATDIASNVMGASAGSVSLPDGSYTVTDVDPGAVADAGTETSDLEINEAAQGGSRSMAFPTLAIIGAAGLGLFLVLRKK